MKFFSENQKAGGQITVCLATLKAALLMQFLVLLVSCASPPSKNVTTAGPSQIHHQDTELARGFDSLVPEHESDSGFILLRHGERALRERLLLADIAEHSIDAQYYIWNSDKSGRLLAYRLIQAAQK